MNDVSDDSVNDCIYITGNVVRLEDLNFLAYTKFGDINGKNTFVNTMLTPENKILLICSYSTIFSLEEDGSINVIKLFHVISSRIVNWYSYTFIN